MEYSSSWIEYYTHAGHQAAMVVLVHTALDHRGSRDLIRETWGENFMPDKPTRLLFALGNHIFVFTCPQTALYVPLSLTDYLRPSSTLLKNTTKEHSERLVTLVLYDTDDDDVEIGVAEDAHVMRSIQAEANLFGDIVQGSFIDSYRQEIITQKDDHIFETMSCRQYPCQFQKPVSQSINFRQHKVIITSTTTIIRNLSYKAILGHYWISSYCHEAELVVKSDDDFFVDLPMLRSLHASLISSQ